MLEPAKTRRDAKTGAPSGFSLLEMMISMVVLLGVMGVVMSAMLQTTHTEGTIQNRTEMHASVRSATELMQQEIGQAGRVSLPNIGNVSLTQNVTASAAAQQVTVTPAGATTGMFVGEYLVIDAGAGYPNGNVGATTTPLCTPSPCSNQETVQVTAVGTGKFSAIFSYTHNNGAPVAVQGGFGTGVVPETSVGMTNGSGPVQLKLYGDINGDGNMVYVEYICDWAASGNLYRSVTSFDSTNNSPAIVAKQVLLPNLVNTGNPGGTACFVYQERPINCSAASTSTNPCFVTDVAVTLTVQTQKPDPSTGIVQKETKALLNVSPRNVFDAYNLSALSNGRVQSMPVPVTALLSKTP